MFWNDKVKVLTMLLKGLKQTVHVKKPTNISELMLFSSKIAQAELLG